MAEIEISAAARERWRIQMGNPAASGRDGGDGNYRVAKMRVPRRLSQSRRSTASTSVSTARMAR